MTEINMEWLHFLNHCDVIFIWSSNSFPTSLALELRQLYLKTRVCLRVNAKKSCFVIRHPAAWPPRARYLIYEAAPFMLMNSYHHKSNFQKRRGSMSSELNHTQCLKIAEKVAFNIASEASYVYILSVLSGQKWSIRNHVAYGQTVLPDKTLSIGQKLVANVKIEKFKCEILADIQTMC